jgi:hypothetical protein
LRCKRVEFVTRWAAIDRISNGFVNNFEDSGFGYVEIFEAGFVDCAFLDDKPRSIGIIFTERNRMSFFNDKRIFLAVDSRVYAEGEDVLMMSTQNLIMNNCTIWKDFFVHGPVDRLGGQNSCCSHFKIDISGLTESPRLN